MSAHDFHQTLGLPPDASAADIKRAYRRLAMRWHPDRNPDPEAHHHFRRVREAFDGLNRTSDVPPMATPADAASAEADPGPPEETPPPPRGMDKRMEIELDLFEAARGATITVTLEGREACESCKGTGQRSYGRTTMCGGCHGSGRLRGPDGLKPCSACLGKGFFTDKSCPSCEARGWHPADRQIAVSVPAALIPGEELRVAGQGGPAPDKGVPGDLYLTLRTRTHALFVLERQDVHITVPVSIFRLLAGGEIQVPTLSGLCPVCLPEGAAQTEVRVAGAGYPGRGRRPAGDLVVHLKTEMPQFLSKEQKGMLDMADQLLMHNLNDQSPALARWNAVLAVFR